MSTTQPSPANTPPLPSNGGGVTVCAQTLEKTPAAVREALDPAQHEQFESEYRAALAHAADTFDLEPVLTLVQRTWWARALTGLNPDMLDGVASDINGVAAGEESFSADEGRLQVGREEAHDSVSCPACLLC